jgi:GMP synthase-like glutamine amidotransferase
VKILVLDLHTGDAFKDSRISDALNKYTTASSLRLLYSDFSYGDLASYDAIVLTGSNNMKIYSDAKTRELRHHLKRLSSNGVNVLGICGGNQVLASTFSCYRYRLPEPEVGWHSIRITEIGRKDPLFKGLKDCFMAFESHILAVRCDDRAKVFAENEHCTQTILYHPSVRGVQFHPEVFPKSRLESLRTKIRGATAETSSRAAECEGSQIFRNFVDIVKTA